MIRYSCSSLGAYENCPLKFKYNKIDRADGLLEESVEAFLGNTVHQTLKKLYDDLVMVKIDSLDEISEYYDSQWEKNWGEHIKIRKKEYDIQHYHSLGKKCVRDYYRKYFPFDRDKTLGLEMKIDICLDDTEKYKLQGVIDRLAQLPDGKYEIHDYKTTTKGGNCPSQSEIDSDRQLALYQIGLSQRWKDVKEVDLVYHFLAFDKELKTYRSKEGLEKLKEETIELIDKIEKAKTENDFPARVSALCDWCEYRHICPEQKHLYMVESLPVNEYIRDDGVQLVNEYIKLKNQQKDMELEMEKLREAVFEFAQRENLRAIRGSEYKLRIKMEEKETLPSQASDPITRKELEEQVKLLGKWMEVSKLDTYTLLKKLRTTEWEEKIKSELKKYISSKEEKQIYSSKIKEVEDPTRDE